MMKEMLWEQAKFRLITIVFGACMLLGYFIGEKTTCLVGVYVAIVASLVALLLLMGLFSDIE